MASALSAESVAVLAGFLKGKRREKFLTSIEILRTAETRGAFEGRESVKALVGFGPGLMSKCKEKISGDFVLDPGAYGRSQERFQAEMCVHYGHAYSGTPFTVEGVPQPVTDAWVKVCTEAHALYKQLKDARPRPVVTAIGLSPKVTATLTDMGLDIDLPTIAPAEIEPFQVQSRHATTGAPLFQKDGVTPVMETHYRVKWQPGTKLNVSRFSYSDGCEACGKRIPSGRFVPIQAQCRQKGLIGMWLGCDCARSIFGVKDLGIAKQ